MSHILYFSAVNYERKHLENSKIESENSWIFLFRKNGNPDARLSWSSWFNGYQGGVLLYW